MEQTRLFEGIIKQLNPEISNKTMKAMIRAGKYPRRYSTEALHRDNSSSAQSPVQWRFPEVLSVVLYVHREVSTPPVNMFLDYYSQWVPLIK
ncbi:hypothetical protein HV211_03470 [Citrobacter freundii]|uniref:hypothetical protein n=1 Tax=Citrobacter freundii TaxID=546 RepID=UPI0015EA7AB3|nr:hypothetical protein [Citrobacter freundii]QLY59593.1 hypothetical protein HV211_03470 [Citrobacter freundii]